MLQFLFMLMVVIGFFMISLLLMAVGVIIKNKGFKSCGCSSVIYKGERIRCPACPGDDGRPVGIE